ncbi:hypothetical protein ANCDUO_17585 [Ancylostoma duodenale]|uniref:Uncharacterized protein n=1 Tax=Ancylostoma duodenale TaxID=51022 RepID=A0A0C2G071_9BILA|nr:hypothetical protein ANCDUO_17585 [Ancylostoma duodenale]
MDKYGARLAVSMVSTGGGCFAVLHIQGKDVERAAARNDFEEKIQVVEENNEGKMEKYDLGYKSFEGNFVACVYMVLS